MPIISRVGILKYKMISCGHSKKSDVETLSIILFHIDRGSADTCCLLGQQVTTCLL